MLRFLNLQHGGPRHLGLSNFIKIGQMAAKFLQLAVFKTVVNRHLPFLKFEFLKTMMEAMME